MRVSKVDKLTWNVFRYDINHRVIRTFNLFDHGSFSKDVKTILKTVSSKDEFAEQLKSKLIYYFWSKYEYEICISALYAYKEKTETKVDVYQQLMMNYDVFVDYVWNSVR